LCSGRNITCGQTHALGRVDHPGAVVLEAVLVPVTADIERPVDGEAGLVIFLPERDLDPEMAQDRGRIDGHALVVYSV
jgi:hypothetical protein